MEPLGTRRGQERDFWNRSEINHMGVIKSRAEQGHAWLCLSLWISVASWETVVNLCCVHTHTPRGMCMHMDTFFILCSPLPWLPLNVGAKHFHSIPLSEQPPATGILHMNNWGFRRNIRPHLRSHPPLLHTLILGAAILWSWIRRIKLS